MMNRTIRRLLSGAALAALAGTAPGCASTRCYLVDSEATSHLVVSELETDGGKTREFGLAGGVYDPAAQAFRGLDREGRTVEYPVAAVNSVKIRPTVGVSTEFVQGLPAPLRHGAAWEPGGRVQFVVGTDGVILDLSGLPSRVDAAARMVRYTPATGAPTTIPFAGISYLQMRETHPWRTAKYALGIGVLAAGVAALIVLSTFDLGLGSISLDGPLF